MILGRVRQHSPLVRLSLPSLEGPRTTEFAVDTGFEGELAIPERLIRRLDVTFEEERSVLMASGREEVCSVYSLTLEWQDDERAVEVMALPGNPLLGMMLLDESHLHVEGAEGGEVMIEPL